MKNSKKETFVTFESRNKIVIVFCVEDISIDYFFKEKTLKRYLIKWKHLDSNHWTICYTSNIRHNAAKRFGQMCKIVNSLTFEKTISSKHEFEQKFLNFK